MVRLSSIQRFRFLLLFLLVDFFENVRTHQTTTNAREQQQAPGHQLSPRTVNTKYGALRGAVLYFQNQQQPNSQPNDKSTNNQNNKQQNSNINNLQPVEFFLGVPYATGML